MSKKESCSSGSTGKETGEDWVEPPVDEVVQEGPTKDVGV